MLNFLANSYKNSLKLAAENNLETIAFPSISTGAFYFPKHEAAKISSYGDKRFFTSRFVNKKIHLVFFSRKDAEIFIKHQDF